MPANHYTHTGPLCAVQVMGPGDGYICQFSPSTSILWAERNRLALGAVFQPSSTLPPSQLPIAGMLPEVRTGRAWSPEACMR